MESVHSKISGSASSRSRGWQQKEEQEKYLLTLAHLFPAKSILRPGLTPIACLWGTRFARYPCGRGNSAISDA